MSTHLVTWISEHVSTVDGRVIQVERTQHCPSYDEALPFALSLGQIATNCQVHIWALVEQIPYRQTECTTKVEEL